MADYGTIKVNKVTYKNGSDADTDFNFKTDVVSSSDVAAKAAKAGDTFTGNIVLDNDKEIRFSEADSNGSAYIGLKAPTDLGSVSSYTLTLPTTAAATNKVLKTDGSTATQLVWGDDTSTDSTKMPLAGGTFTGNVNAGVDDTGVDVKFFGATAGAYLLWDESADSLLTGGGATIDIVKDKLKIGGTAVTTTAAELNLLDGKTAVGDAVLATDFQEWTGTQRGYVKALGTITDFNIPLDQGNHFTATLNTNNQVLTFKKSSGAALDSSCVGVSGVIYLTLGGTHTITYASHVKKASGVSIPATAGDYIIPYTVIATDKVCIDVIAVG